MKSSDRDRFKKTSGCPMCGNPQIFPQEIIKEYNFSRCRHCEFTFCPDITNDFLSRLYSDGFRGPEDGGPSRGWSKHTDFLSPAFELLQYQNHLRILDFGCGQSLIPDQLRQNGHTVYAVDVAPPLRTHRHRFTGDILELGLKADSFDLVYSFQVFEHLPNPRPILQELLRLAKPGGLVLIHTDMETPERENEGFANWWYVMPPDHCAFYRHRTFQRFWRILPTALYGKMKKE